MWGNPTTVGTEATNVREVGRRVSGGRKVQRTGDGLETLDGWIGRSLDDQTRRQDHRRLSLLARLDRYLDRLAGQYKQGFTMHGQCMVIVRNASFCDILLL